MNRRGLACAVIIAACHGASTEGEVGGACYPNGTCNAMLKCIGGVCIGPDAPPRPTVTATLASDVDILFVIDNSASTSDKQAQFAANFPNFVTALNGSPLGPLNVHLGVATTTVSVGNSNFGANCANGDDGLLQNTPCSTRGTCTTTCTAPTGRFIIDVKNSGGGRTTNYTEPTLAAAFTCIAQVGATGCGFEAQLEAMKRALDGSRSENAGFIRDGAYLAVIILTDEDDCSVKDPTLFNLAAAQAGPGDFRCQPLFGYKCDTAISSANPGTYTNCAPLTGSYLKDPADYYGFLSTVKDPAQIVVAFIGGGSMNGGPPSGAVVMTGAITSPFSQALALQPSCTATVNGQFAIARPGIRINDFVTQFGDRGLFQTICTADYTPALMQIATLLFNSISPCLEGPIDPTDIDPNNPGIQLDCTVSDVVGGGTSMPMETPIPPCTMTNATTPAPGQGLCYWISMNTAACAPPLGGLQINFVRSSAPAVGTTTNVACAVKPQM
jgi:hypothetical protein